MAQWTREQLLALGHPLTEAELQALGDAYLAITDFKQREVYYQEHIYPQLRDHFKTLPAADPPIQVLLVPVSGPHVPVLVAARWKPQVVHTIYSSVSVRHRTFIKKEIANLGLGIEVRGDDPVESIEFEPDRLYKAVKEALKPYVKPDQLNPQVAIDITGGTSVMSVGAAMAVSLVGGRFFYVLSPTAKDDIQLVQKGTSEPRVLTDPYAVFGDWEAAKARRLFTACDYRGAHRIFDDLAARERMPVQEAAEYHAYALLSQAYAAWDGFVDLEEACKTLQQLLELPTLPPALEKCRATLVAQRDGLQKLAKVVVPGSDVIEITHDLETLGDPNIIRPLLGSCYTSSRRRAEQPREERDEIGGLPSGLEIGEAQAPLLQNHSRYDMAALLLYRCLELISQHRLAAGWNISTELTDYSIALSTLNITIDDLRGKYSEVAKQQNKKRESRGRKASETRLPTSKIGMFAGYMLLLALGDHLVKDGKEEYPIDQIEVRAEVRNLSILAHGYRLIRPKDYEWFREVVDQVIDRLFTYVLKEKRGEWEKIYYFVNPFVGQ
jgi:CRISPR-associated protein (TIGR02710 family)